mmetsp:Transcript_96569/g.312593  ORF Transcript_96569/g.312593 Transcript_96569/m.312593 type:complete len:223 (-) Transcript_96569:598-1266(-)
MSWPSDSGSSLMRPLSPGWKSWWLLLSGNVGNASTSNPICKASASVLTSKSPCNRASRTWLERSLFTNELSASFFVGALSSSTILVTDAGRTNKPTSPSILPDCASSSMPHQLPVAESVLPKYRIVPRRNDCETITSTRSPTSKVASEAVGADALEELSPGVVCSPCCPPLACIPPGRRAVIRRIQSFSSLYSPTNLSLSNWDPLKVKMESVEGIFVARYTL